MKTIFSFVLFGLISAASIAQQPILVTPQWLNDHKADPNVVILQVSFMKYEYDNAHIEGAGFLWPEWLAPNSPYGAYNAPDPKRATELLRSFGISDNSHVVLYYVRNEIPAAARMFLTLENLGLRGKVSLLNGGMDAWLKENYLVTSAITLPKKGNISVKEGDLLVPKEHVLQALKTGNGVVADARPQRYYDGEPTGNPRDGHITGAVNIPYVELIDASNKIKPEDQLTPYFSPVAPKEKEIVTYCFIGQTASVVYLAGRILGYNVKLYDGSMQEWSRLDNLPMETTKK